MALYIKKNSPDIFSAASGINIFSELLLDCCAFVLFYFCARRHHQHQLNFKLGKVKPCHMHRHCQNFKKKNIVNIFFLQFLTQFEKKENMIAHHLIIRMSYDDHHIIILAKYQPVPPDIDQVPPQPQHFFLGWPLFTSPPCNAELSQLDVVQTKICLLFS